MLTIVKNKLARLLKCEDGSSIIELAIVFPILLVLFVGCAELGRLFYTYTTLAKATKVGARYLSTSRDVTSPDGPTVAAAKLKAKSLVVCGYTDCSNRTPIVPGLTVAQVNIPPMIVTNPTLRYWEIEIQNFNYQPGVFNLELMTAQQTSTFYFSLAPKTRMRYMR